MTPNGLFIISVLTCGELYKKRKIVGLHLCIVRRTVSSYSAAFFASVYYYISLFGIGKHLYGAQMSVTFLGSVAGVFVNVERPQTKGAVIARAVSEWLYFLSAVRADKGVVVFCKSLLFKFHIKPSVYLVDFVSDNINII